MKNDCGNERNLTRVVVLTVANLNQEQPMTTALEQWPSIERWETKIEKDWKGKREIPFLKEIIKSAASLRFGRSFELQEIADSIGISPQQYSNDTKDNHCSFEFLIKISRWLGIPVNIFAQVSELSKDYERTYALDPVAGLKVFEDEARRFLQGRSGPKAYEQVLNKPDNYEPSGSSSAKIDIHRCDRAGNPVPSDRGARRIGAADFKPDHLFHVDDRFEIIVHGNPGWNVILLESPIIPYKVPDWGMLNGALPHDGTLVGPCGRNGIYSFKGAFGPPLGCYRISAAILNPNRPIEPWWRIQAGAGCPEYLLDQLAGAASAGEKECYLTSFTYELVRA